MINKMISKDVWEQIRLWIKSNVRQHTKIALIGSGVTLIKYLK